jgi:hypothetical protein
MEVRKWKVLKKLHKFINFICCYFYHEYNFFAFFPKYLNFVT